MQSNEGLTCLELPGLVGLQAAHLLQDLHGSGGVQVQPNVMLLPIRTLHPHHLQLVGPAQTWHRHVFTQCHSTAQYDTS